MFLRGAAQFGSPIRYFTVPILVRNRSPFFREVDSGYFEDAELCFDVLDKAKFAFVHQILTCAGAATTTPSQRVWSASTGVVNLCIYVVTKRYGPRYLDESELAPAWPKPSGTTTTSLRVRCRSGEKSGFWRWHARGLEQAGDRINWSRVALLQFPRLLNAPETPRQR